MVNVLSLNVAIEDFIRSMMREFDVPVELQNEFFSFEEAVRPDRNLTYTDPMGQRRLSLQFYDAPPAIRRVVVVSGNPVLCTDVDAIPALGIIRYDRGRSWAFKTAPDEILSGPRTYSPLVPGVAMLDNEDDLETMARFYYQHIG